MMISHQIVCIRLSLAAPLEPFTHRQNVASLNDFYRYYFDRCSSELDELIPLPLSRGQSTRYSNRLHYFHFFVTIPVCYKDVYINNFFPRTPRLWNSLPTKCVYLTSDLNFFKSRFKRHIQKQPPRVVPW